MNSNEIIYPLGSGCNVYSHLRFFENLKKYTVSKNNSLCYNFRLENSNYNFLLKLFNGEFQKDILNSLKLYRSGKYDEFVFQNSRQVGGIRGANLLTPSIDFCNRKTGYTINHIDLNAESTIYFRYNKENALSSRFNFLKNNKLFFIINFSRKGYESYSNIFLLDFEKYLIENNYDLNDFLYCDYNDKKNRFKNTRIKFMELKRYNPEYFQEHDQPIHGPTYELYSRIDFQEYVLEQVKRIQNKI